MTRTVFGILLLLCSAAVSQVVYVTGGLVNLYLSDWPGGNYTIVNGATGNADQGLCLVMGITTIGYEYNMIPRVCTLAIGSYNVAGLPAGVYGQMTTVNDAMTCINGQPVTGLGSTLCLVWFNSVAWHAIAP
jgi:hypothetical protein